MSDANTPEGAAVVSWADRALLALRLALAVIEAPDLAKVHPDTIKATREAVRDAIQ